MNRGLGNLLVLILLLKTPRFKYMQPHIACMSVLTIDCIFVLLRQVVDMYGSP